MITQGLLEVTHRRPRLAALTTLTVLAVASLKVAEIPAGAPAFSWAASLNLSDINGS